MLAAGSDKPVISNVSIGLNVPAYFSLISFQHHWIDLYSIRKINFQSISECEKSGRISPKQFVNVLLKINLQPGKVFRFWASRQDTSFPCTSDIFFSVIFAILHSISSAFIFPAKSRVRSRQRLIAIHQTHIKHAFLGKSRSRKFDLRP